MTTSEWQPFQEPLSATLTRTMAIALIAGAAVSLRWGSLSRWPMATLVMLWPSFGGHWIELWFLNWLRPRLADSRGVQVAARIAVWFIGGTTLAVGMVVTATLVGLRLAHWPPWWVGGLAFIGIELVPHLVFQLRGRPSFYNGRG